MEGKIMEISELLTMQGYTHRVPAGNTGTLVRVSKEDDILVQAYCKQI